MKIFLKCEIKRQLLNVTFFFLRKIYVYISTKKACDKMRTNGKKYLRVSVYKKRIAHPGVMAGKPWLRTNQEIADLHCGAPEQTGTEHIEGGGVGKRIRRYAATAVL